MARATINIAGVIGGKEMGFKGASFGYTDLLVQLAKYPDAEGYDFVIDTDGGNVAEGFRIAEVIENLPDTRTIAKKVYSIGTVLFFAGKQRIAENGADFLLHPVSINSTAIANTQLTADALRELADDIEETGAIIAGYIASRSGISIQKIAALMAVDRYVSEEEASALGFFNVRRFFSKEFNFQNFNNMANGIWDKITGKAKAIFSTLKNMAVTLADGNEIFIETEDGIVVGKKAFTTEGGEPLADGEYQLQDGRTLTVVAGVVEAESEDAGEMPEGTEEADDMGKKMQEALDKIAALEAELMKYRTDAKATEETLDNVRNEKNRLDEENKQMKILLNNVGRLTSKALPVQAGTQNFNGVIEQPTAALTFEQQKALAEKARKALNS